MGIQEGAVCPWGLAQKEGETQQGHAKDAKQGPQDRLWPDGI